MHILPNKQKGYPGLTWWSRPGCRCNHTVVCPALLVGALT